MTVQGPKQGGLLVNAIINDVEIVGLVGELSVRWLVEVTGDIIYPGKHMFVYQMQSSFLRSGAFPLACLDEAAILLGVVS